MTANTLTALPTKMSRDLKVMRTGFRILGAITPRLAGRVAARLFLTPRKRPVSQRAREIMAQADRSTIYHGSRELATYVWGDSGPTVLLVHGWESNASGMRAFIRPLLRQGFRVVAFDAPAHGNSTGRQTNIVDFSGALQTVVGEVGPVHGIIAHSFGASTTLYTLSRDSSFQVNRVVSIAAPSRLRDMFDAWINFVGFSDATSKLMMQRLVDRVGIPIDNIQVETAVTNLTIPGLIIHDKQDRVADFANAEVIADNWQTAEIMVTEGLDHRGPLQDRAVIRKTVAFMTIE